MSDSGMVGECLTLGSHAIQLAVDLNEQATCSLLGVTLMACSEAEFSNSVLSSSLFDMKIKTLSIVLIAATFYLHYLLLENLFLPHFDMAIKTYVHRLITAPPFNVIIYHWKICS